MTTVLIKITTLKTKWKLHHIRINLISFNKRIILSTINLCFQGGSLLLWGLSITNPVVVILNRKLWWWIKCIIKARYKILENRFKCQILKECSLIRLSPKIQATLLEQDILAQSMVFSKGILINKTKVDSNNLEIKLYKIMKNNKKLRPPLEGSGGVLI